MEKLSFDTHYFKVPNELVHCRDLNWSEKLIFCIICRYSNERSTAEVSYKRLADDAGCSRSQAIKAIKSLEEKGIVRAIRQPLSNKNHKPSKYEIINRPSAPGEPGVVYEVNQPSAPGEPNKERSIKNNNKEILLHIPHEPGNGAGVPSDCHSAANNKLIECGNISKADILHVEHSSTCEQLFNELWQLYPRKRGKGSIDEDAKKALHAIGREELVRCIDRFSAEMKAQNRPEDKVPYGSTFFTSGYIDYLDENYNEPVKKKPFKITV